MSDQFSVGDKVYVYSYFHESGNEFIYSNESLIWAKNCNYTIIQVLGEILYDSSGEFFVLLQDDKPELLKYTLLVTEQHIIYYNLDKSYLRRKGCYVLKDALQKVSSLAVSSIVKEGYNCCICREYYQYAISNQSNGTFGCYRCKTDPRNGLER